MASVEIDINGAKGQIRLDGRDIGGAVGGLRLDCKPGNLPQLTLDVVAREVIVHGEAQVYIAPATRELLVNLGWVPPGAVKTAGLRR